MESTSQSYHFQSLATKYVIVSDGTEKDGDIVATINGVGPHTVSVACLQQMVFSNSALRQTLTASKVIEGSGPVIASVTGVAGLYLALPEV